MKQILILACGLLLLAGCKKSVEPDKPDGMAELVSGTAPGGDAGGGGDVVIDPNGFPCLESYETWNNNFPGVQVPVAFIPGTECRQVVKSRSSAGDTDFWRPKFTPATNNPWIHSIGLSNFSSNTSFRVIVYDPITQQVILDFINQPASGNVTVLQNPYNRSVGFCLKDANGVDCDEIDISECLQGPLVYFGPFNPSKISVEIRNLNNSDAFCYNYLVKYIGQ